MNRSTLFPVLLAGVVCLATAARAQVPNCDCILSCGDDLNGMHRHGQNKRPWDMPVGGCLVACPGEWGLPGHTPGSETDWRVCIYGDDQCTVPLEGYEDMRLDLFQVPADSICVCDEECPSMGGSFGLEYPIESTDSAGCTSFRWRGSILALDPTATGPWLQVEFPGPLCWAEVCVRSPDLNADCDVDLADFVVWAGAFLGCPPQPLHYQQYTVYTAHCAPCAEPQLADFVVFARHFGHSCEPGDCDP